jgi:hypothetical protein
VVMSTKQLLYALGRAARTNEAQAQEAETRNPDDPYVGLFWRDDADLIRKAMATLAEQFGLVEQDGGYVKPGCLGCARGSCDECELRA